MVVDISIQLLIDQIQVKCVNTLLYPVSVSNCTNPERGILGIFIGDLTSTSALLLLTLLSAHRRYTEDYWFFYNESREGE